MRLLARRTALTVPLVAVLVTAACALPRAGAAPAGSAASGTGTLAGSGVAPQTGMLAGRPYAAYLPTVVGGRRVPLVLFLHGGGGNATNAQGTTCADGDPTSATCLQALGRREGFITVYASGTPNPHLSALRTWNAGGGTDYACASGYACDAQADDIGYLRALVADLERRYPVDPTRVYVMGFSNGAAMAHRVGCEMADVVAAVVPVSGENEYATAAPCDPVRPVPVVDVHGTADDCWTYGSSTRACADPDPRPKIGAVASTAGWVARDRCAPTPRSTSLPDRVDDGTTTTEQTWSCAAGTRVTLLTVHGGGHVFPGGATVRTGTTETVTHDWDVTLLWRLVSGYRLT